MKAPGTNVRACCWLRKIILIIDRS